jgi:hypothetical protein
MDTIGNAPIYLSCKLKILLLNQVPVENVGIKPTSNIYFFTPISILYILSSVNPTKISYLPNPLIIDPFIDL